jgi:predicted  nucleic acid-binding Zn-ribbon protein
MAGDSDLRAQMLLLEADIADIRKERNAFREDLSRSRARVAELQSIVEAHESEIRDLRRQLRFSMPKVSISPSLWWFEVTSGPGPGSSTGH